jgi:hypothetical protein
VFCFTADSFGASYTDSNLNGREQIDSLLLLPTRIPTKRIKLATPNGKSRCPTVANSNLKGQEQEQIGSLLLTVILRDENKLSTCRYFQK